MQTNNHQLVDYDAVLDAKFGAKVRQADLKLRKKPMHSIPDRL